MGGGAGRLCKGMSESAFVRPSRERRVSTRKNRQRRHSFPDSSVSSRCTRYLSSRPSSRSSPPTSPPRQLDISCSHQFHSIARSPTPLCHTAPTQSHFQHTRHPPLSVPPPSASSVPSLNMPGRQLLLLTLLALSATAALSNSSITAGCSGSADLDSLGGLEKLGLVLQPGFEGAGEKWEGLGTLWDGVKDVNGAEEDVYSAVIAIGASYTGASLPLPPHSAFESRFPLTWCDAADNAHPRLPEHAGSLRDTFPYNLYGGRYANGKIAVERLAEELMARPREALDRRGEQGEDEEDLRLFGCTCTSSHCLPIFTLSPVAGFSAAYLSVLS